MGEYQEKVEKHFWMLVCSSKISIDDEKAYRTHLEPIFKIKSKEAMKLVEDPLWSRFYSLTKKATNPEELRSQLDPIVQIDAGKVRDHIWKLMTILVSHTLDEKSFRENFEPVFRIDSKKAIHLFEDLLWSIFYSKAKKIHDPEEMSKQFAQLVHIDIKSAAEAIKKVDPEKYHFLQLYKK